MIWLLKIKYNGRYHSRLVSKGFLQREGVDYVLSHSQVLWNITFLYLLIYNLRKIYLNRILKRTFKSRLLIRHKSQQILVNSTGQYMFLLKKTRNFMMESPSFLSRRYSRSTKENYVSSTRMTYTQGYTSMIS